MRRPRETRPSGAAWLALLVVLAVTVSAELSPELLAQGRGRGRGGPPPTPREAAPVDLTGYWVSVVSEDWRWRMVTPARGDVASVPLNAAGMQVAAAWDPARDETAGNACKGYGAAAIMRVPGRLHITWDDDRTLRIETDAGMQTRLLHFSAPAGRGAPGPASDRGTPGPESRAALERSWQGYSVAQWEPPVRGAGLPDFFPVGLNPRVGVGGRSLEVVTTQLRAGYLRKNGVPYGENAVVREYFDLSGEPNGDTWFAVTTIVEDAQYLLEPFVTSTNFKKEPDGSRWNPTPCTVD